MRKYFPHDDWFRCESCDHMFTVRIPAEGTQPPEEHLPEHGLSDKGVAWDD